MHKYRTAYIARAGVSLWFSSYFKQSEKFESCRLMLDITHQSVIQETQRWRKNNFTKAGWLAIFCSCASTRHYRFSSAFSGERATPVRLALPWAFNHRRLPTRCTSLVMHGIGTKAGLIPEQDVGHAALGLCSQWLGRSRSSNGPIAPQCSRAKGRFQSGLAQAPARLGVSTVRSQSHKDRGACR